MKRFILLFLTSMMIAIGSMSFKVSLPLAIAHTQPEVVNDILNSSNTPVLTSLRACLPQTPEHAPQPHTFGILTVLADSGAQQDPNPERPIKYFYINVYSPWQGQKDEPWQTLIALRKDETCKNYIPDQVYIDSLTRFMPFELAKTLELKLHEYRTAGQDPAQVRQEIAYGVSDAWQPGPPKPGKKPGEEPEEYSPCEMSPERAWLTESLGVLISPTACKIFPIETPVWQH